METNMNVNTDIENNGGEDGTPFEFTHNQKKLLAAYEKCSCNISEACRMAGLSRVVFYYSFNNTPEFKEAIEMLQEEDLDFAEGQLKFLMSGQFVYRKRKDANGKDIPVLDPEGKPIPNQFELELDAMGAPIREYITPIDNASVMFKLKTQGKKRGYVYRQEVTGADGNAIGGFEINIVRKKKGE